ncbi:non-hydrolyzing UDP-N-acetylglucosamine 2-epimerase [Photorhabdus hindustanensis]|uniref:UDP-N-acetylglucosamine 2-epimerase n=1 Tax=Photorhabdus hindustanensis TaxID=2918802 RepID=A0A2S8Q862_9GAMM|nr:UDP-N-acetylglucosamine 2-epimerase (non-hydrolyzing) [Photorhabdus hindustanensis]PQQ29151.1 UDP-N-acetylglucosamine 2-epimerase (non-hydrolyzing) [Photorhabdus hindustanensis]
MKIISVFGTRPEAIKMAPLIKELEKDPNIHSIICVTGQHRKMLDQVIELFGIKPDFDLNIMKENQNLTSITSEILVNLEYIFDKTKPDLVLVHGDTTTSFVASMAAYYKKIKVAHIEAGLRTNDIYSPWPEEGNRKLISILSHLHFTPTNEAKNNLIHEGIPEDCIYITGNTVIDALLETIKKINSNDFIKNKLKNEFQFIDFSKKIILITGHRRENFGKGINDICHAIKHLANEFKDIIFVYPVHLNPNIKKPAEDILSNVINVFLISPLDYLSFIYLMSKSYLILTDSGGIQEEAPSLNIPVLVMRNNSERPEAIKSGSVKLIGSSTNKIIMGVTLLLKDKKIYNNMKNSTNPYGDGQAAKKIVHILKNL